MKVYILSIYEENGAEQVKATLDKSKLPAMLRTFKSSNYGEGRLLEVEADELLKLEEFLKADLASEHGCFLSRGWGGFVLHIVELQ